MTRAIPTSTEARPADPDDSAVDQLLGTRKDSAREIARLALEQELDRERRLLHAIIESLPVSIYAKDTQSRFIACNTLVAQLMGTTPAAAIGRTDFDFYPPEIAARFFADDQAVIRSGQALIEHEELILDRASGDIRHFASTKVPFHDHAGNIVGLIGLGRDITERRRTDQQIRHLATHDSLTDLLNRPAFSEALSTAIAEARSRCGRFALLFIDLDHFKLINDSLGHQAGDELLKQIAVQLRAGVREDDPIARLGGDEFVVLCKEPLELNDIDGIASRVLQAATGPVFLLGEERRISASVGVAVYPDDGDTERMLMRSADRAMYMAKQEGRSTYRLSSRCFKAIDRAMVQAHARAESTERAPCADG